MLNRQISQLETDLRAVVEKELGWDLTDMSAEDVGFFAQMYCKLSFDPDAINEQAYQKVKQPGLEQDEKVKNKAVKEAASLIWEANAEFEALKSQVEIKRQLARCFEHGSVDMGIAPDPLLEEKYSVGKGPDKSKSEEFYTKVTWYTRWRLFGIRANRFLDNFDAGILKDDKVTNPFLNFFSSNFTKIVAYAGLSYFVELLFDLGIMFRAAWNASPGEGWKMFKITFLKGDRPYRIGNDSWGVGNLWAILDPALSPIINLVLFTYDFIADTVKLFHHRWRWNRLLDKTKAKTVELERQISRARLDGHDPSELIAKLEKNRQIEKSIRASRQTVYEKRGYLLFITTLILIGMVFILVPKIIPALVVTGVIAKFGPTVIAKIGAGLAWAGSIIGGLGKALIYDTAWPALKKKMGWGQKPKLSEIEMTRKKEKQEKHLKNNEGDHNKIVKLLSSKNLYIDTSNDSPEIKPELLTPKDIKKAAKYGLACSKSFKESPPKPLLKRFFSEPVLAAAPSSSRPGLSPAHSAPLPGGHMRTSSAPLYHHKQSSSSVSGLREYDDIDDSRHRLLSSSMG
ncbi:MAG TPA: hypothetical protein VLI69_03720 [Gammaproteobacteria bacterium]|nr:hypothetical protein [Gammaproteobacteria bacterium]